MQSDQQSEGTATEENAPVAYIIFNRPDVTRESFARIREHRPTRLYIIADAPRSDHPTDAALCAEARQVVAEVDWPCEVRRNYADHNMGCKQRVSSGLNWVFSYEDRAIVIEDDCLPHPDFFKLCNEILNRHANDPRIATITGDNFQRGIRRGEASYYYSRYVQVWGWATWKRAWDPFDADMSFWREWRASEDWIALFSDPIEREYWEGKFDIAERGGVDSWAYPYLATTWHRGGLTVTPNVNLVTNVGFDSDATHTTRPEPHASVATSPLGEIVHPQTVRVDEEADRFTFDYHFGGIQIRQRRRPLGFIQWVVSGGLRVSKRKLNSWRRN